MRRNQSVGFCLAAFFLGALSAGAQTPVAPEVKNSAPVAKDMAVLELEAPEGATITLNGQDVGQKRRFEFGGMKLDRFDKHQLVVKPPNGGPVARSILLRGGWEVRVPWFGPGQLRPELQIQAQHSGDIMSLAFSPDGRYMLSGSSDCTAVLWDVRTARRLRTFDGHDSPVTHVAFSDGGRGVLTCSKDERAVLWDLKSGDRVREFKVPKRMHQAYPKVAAAVSGDGKSLLLSGGECIETYDPASGRLLDKQEMGDGGFSGEITAVALNSDGKVAAAGNIFGGITLWEPSTGRKPHVVEPFQSVGKFDTMAFSADGKHLAASYDPGFDRPPVVVLYDVAARKLLWQRKLVLGRSFPLAFSPDGRWVFISNGCVAVRCDLSDGTGKDFELPVGGAVAVSPDSKSIAVANENGIQISDTVTGKISRAFGPRLTPVSRVAFRPDGREFLTADSRVSAWSAASGRRFALLEDRKDLGRPVSSLQYREDGRSALVAGALRYISVWDPSNNHALVRANTEYFLASGVVAAHLIENGRRAAVGFQSGASDGSKGCVVIFDLKNGSEVRRFEGLSGMLSDVAASPDGRLTTISRGVEWMAPVRLTTIDSQSGKNLEAPQPVPEPSRVVYSPEGSRILLVDAWQKVVLFNREMTKQLREIKMPTYIWRAAFSPDGKCLALACGDKTPTLWDADSGEIIRRFEGHTAGFSDIAISADNRLVLTAGHDGTSRLWDVATGLELAAMITINDSKDWLVVTPDGLFDGSAGGRESVTFRVVGLEVVPVDRFFQDFYRPGLLASLFRGERPRPDVKLGDQKPPSLKLLSPNAGSTDKTEVGIQVEASDEGGGITGPWLVHNGVRVRGESKTTKQGKILRRTFTLVLAPGENRIEVKAASADGSWESEPARVTLRYEKQSAKVAVHVLAIGVNRYSESSLNLKFAANDAKAVSDLFRRRGVGLFRAGEFRTLLDADATQEKIHDAVRAIAKAAKPEDVLVVFLAGHGTALGQRYFYVPADFKRTDAPSVEDDIRKQGLAGDVLASWLEEVPATKRVIVFDTCQSGAAIGMKARGRNPFAFQGAIETLRRSNGAHTIAAAAAGEEANEIDDLGHGILTYALLAGLKAVDRGPLRDKWIKPNNAEEVVDVFEWFSYAAGQVPRIAESYYKARQNVSVSSADNIFPVLPLGER